MALVVVGVAVVLAACGWGGTSDGESGAAPPAPIAEPKPEPEPEPEPEQESEFEFECATLGISIDELPNRWNTYIDQSGSGFKLPELIEATGTILGLSEYVQYLDSRNSALSAITVYWHPKSGQVREVTINGDVATSLALTRKLTNTAGAMVFSVTTLSLEEAGVFLVDRLMVGINELQPGGFIIDLVEEDDRAFRFNVAGGGADWSAVGSRPCP
jgi:hypothetical protein